MSRTHPSRFPHFGLIASLYVSQAIPLGFFLIAVPAILRQQGMPLEKIGLISALALPWLIKFLWAPLVDRHGSRSRGHYRSWILPLQSMTVLCVVAMSLVDLETQWGLLVLAGGAFMLLSATQDIATDGLVVRTLERDQRGTGNGIQVGGYYLGQILGGGAALLLYSGFGWTAALLAMAAFLALPLLPTLRLHEPPFEVRERERPGHAALVQFMRRPGAGAWIAILLLYRMGEAMAVTMLNPMLVDIGYSLAEIAVLLGMAGSLGALVGALVGGLTIRRIGRRASLVVCGLLQAAGVSAFLLPATGTSGMAVVYGVVMFNAFAGGTGTAALYTNMMDRSDARTAATDFTLQQSICAFGPMLGAATSGFIASSVGYPLHFLLAASVNLLAIAIIFRWLTAQSAAPAPLRLAE